MPTLFWRTVVPAQKQIHFFLLTSPLILAISFHALRHQQRQIDARKILEQVEDLLPASLQAIINLEENGIKVF